MRFSKAFGIPHSQPELDFIDVDNGEDLPLFFDPYVFATEQDAFSQACATNIQSFFNTALDCVRAQDHKKGRQLFSYLREPNELCLGWSKGRPRGRGIGAIQAGQLYDALASSEAAQTGSLSDLSEAELFVEGIGPDKISDITANVIRQHLIGYTQDQCDLHGITRLSNVPAGPVWNPEELSWETRYQRLPIVSGRPVILVPKRTVRWINNLSHQHRKFYRHFVLNFLKDEQLRGDGPLVHVLRNGKRRVYKTELQRIYPLSKDFLFRFSQDNPEVLENYRRAYRKTKAVEINELDEDFDTEIFVDSLIERLKTIPPGTKHADDFHRLMVGLLEFVFHPNLSNPKKEQPIHSGRKRIDIGYVNAARDGFFFRMHSHHNVTSLWVIVECKNYSSDPQNPELDQLSSRFSANRGRFGLLVARRFEDRATFIARCRDTASDGRGYIIPLVDEDIVRMLTLIREGKRSQIDSYLEARLRELM